MENFGRLHRVEVILNRDFLEISPIASAFPLALSLSPERVEVIGEARGGRGGWKILRNITWFSGKAEGDQLSSIEYKGGGV